MSCDDGNDCDEDDAVSSEDWDSGPFCRHWSDPGEERRRVRILELQGRLP